MDLTGYIAAITAAASWAVASVAISRLLVHGTVTPAAANLFKNGLAASFFFVAALLLGGRWPVGEAWGWLFVSGLLGFAISDTLYFAAFRRCGVQTAATVMLFNVPAASLLAVPISGDRLQSAVLPFMGVALVGIALVILDSRTTARASRVSRGVTGASYWIGVLLAVLAAFSIGLSLPIGRHRFDEVGVWPGSFIRLAGGALGAVPLAALSGLARGTRPATEVGRLVEPLFRAPGPSSVWGRTALIGVGVAILGLIPYHYALRELPSGIASILFATTPLFTIPLSLVIRQRVGWLAVVGSVVGVVGVAGILAVENGVLNLPQRFRPSPVEGQRPNVVPLNIEAPEGARYPTFVVGVEPVDDKGAAGKCPPMLAFVGGGAGAPEGAAAGERAKRLLLLGFNEFAGPSMQSVVEELGEDAPSERMYIHFADTPRAARLSSGGLVITHLEHIEPESLRAGVRVSISDAGPPGRDLGWLHADASVAGHGYLTLVADEPGGNVVAAWLDGRARTAATGAQLYTRSITPAGELTEEIVLDSRVVDSCPTAGVQLVDGTIVIAYRDRSDDDAVDVAVVRRDQSGNWSGPAVVHEDDWSFNGPLVNGPALAADEDWLVAAWFLNLPEGEPAIRVAFSSDGGRSFRDPTTLAQGRTRGQVALASMGGGAFALVHQALAPEGSPTGARDTWQVALVGPRGDATEFVRVGGLFGRSSGRLDLTSGPPGVVFATWTGTDGLSAARITSEAIPAEESAEPLEAAPR